VCVLATMLMVNKDYYCPTRVRLKMPCRNFSVRPVLADSVGRVGVRSLVGEKHLSSERWRSW